MNYTNEWFKLFSNCILIEGYKESAIYDLGRFTYYSIPNQFAFLLSEIQSKRIQDIFLETNYAQKDIEIFMNKFINEEIAFFTDEPKSFPSLSIEYESPYIITNSIIQINSFTYYDVNNIIMQLENLGCQAVQLIFEYNIKLVDLKNYFSFFDETKINSIDVLIPFNEERTDEMYFNLISTYPRIRKFYNYSSNKNEIITNDDILFNKRVIYTTSKINNNDNIKKENFLFNVQSFSESQNYNLGLNKKVCITSDGEIKNFLSHEKTYGNVNNTKISDAINKKSFKDKWNISNSKIVKCMDCQFRYCCESNSDIYKKNNKYYKASLCNFDPYTNTWKE